MNELREAKESPGEGVETRPSRRGRPGGKAPEEKRCRHTWEDGRRCRAWRIKESEWCFFHDPEANRPPRVPALLSATELHAVLVQAVKDLREKRISPGEAYALGYLVQLLSTLQKHVHHEYSTVIGEDELLDAIEWGVEKAAQGSESSLDAAPDDA